MAANPETWSAEEVQAFFEQQTASLPARHHASTRQALTDFITKIGFKDITGEFLLDLSEVELKSDLELDLIPKKLVLKWINALREQSQASNLSAEHTIVTPPQVSVLSTPLDNKKRLLETSLDEQSTNDLNHAPIESEPPVVKPSKRLKITEIQTTTKPLTASTMFYGCTKIGEVITFDDTASSYILADQRDDREFANKLYAQVSQADRQYAYKRMKHFLVQRPTYTEKNGKITAYIEPYAPGFKSTTSSPQSAIVFKRGSNGSYIAVRGRLVESVTGTQVSLTDPGTTDMYTYLADKYAHDDDESSVIELQHCDDQSSDSDSSEDAESSDACEETDDEIQMPAAERDAAIDEAIKNIQANWRATKLPKLEQQKASQVWDRMRHSRVLRDAMVEAAEQRIRHLVKRQLDLRQRLFYAEPATKEEINKAVGAMEPTLHDILKEQWHINVYGRKERPIGQRPEPRKPASNVSASTNAEVSASKVAFPNLGIEDQFSPVHEAPSASQHMLDEPAQDVEMIDGAATVQNDEMADGASTTQELTRRKQRQVSDDFLESFVVPDTPTRPRRPSLIVKLPIEPRNHHARAGARSRKEQQASQNLPSQGSLANGNPNGFNNVADSDDEDDKPIGSNRRQKQPQPMVCIEISSDSSSPTAPFVKAVKRKPTQSKATRTARVNESAAYNATLETITLRQLDMLSIQRLVDEGARQKLLLKLLAMEDSAMRSELLRASSLMLGFAAFLESCLDSLLSNAIAGEGAERSCLPHHAKIALLYIAWYTPLARADMSACSIQHIKMAIGDKDDKDPKSRTQINFFRNELSACLKRKDLFRAIPANPRQSSASQHKPSTSESEAEIEEIFFDDRPSKKVKPVHLDRNALNKRKAAKERADKASQLQGSQPDVSSQLAHADTEDIEVNTSRDVSQPPIHINKRIAHSIKPHQVDGVRFMFRELTAEGEDDDVRGCLLSHTMGLGKTMQTITTAITLTEAARSDDPDITHQLPRGLRLHGRATNFAVLVLCPPAVVDTWVAEIKRWASANELGDIFRCDSKGLRKSDQVDLMKTWRDEGGIMILGYSRYRDYVNLRWIKDKNDVQPTETTMAETAKDVLLNTAVVVVLDEAQNIKNAASDINQAVRGLKARFRIALTGTPLSNAIDEVYELISWVAPGYLGEEAEFKRRFTSQIKAGLYQDSTPHQKRASTMRLRVLHAEIGPKYQRKDVTVLKGEMTNKVEYIITLALTPTQIELYSRLVAVLKAHRDNDEQANTNILAWFSRLSNLTCHPSAFRNKMLQPPPKPRQRKAMLSVSTELEVPMQSSDELDGGMSPASAAESEVANIDEISHGLSKKDLEDILGALYETDNKDEALSAKIILFLQILQGCLARGDKILVFSSALDTLDYLTVLLQNNGIPAGRIDGTVPPTQRTPIIEQMNNDEFHVMLISTKAGGVGLNIQSANRVFIFDSSFNPTNEEQAVGRAYRIGQTKPVYVYRFIAGGTFETRVWNTQLFKSSLAKRVVDKKNPIRHAKKDEEAWLQLPQPVEQEDIKKELGKDPGVLDDIIQSQLVMGCGCDPTSRIYAISTMETLQIDVEEPLEKQDEEEVEQEISKVKETRKSRRLMSKRTMDSLAGEKTINPAAPVAPSKVSSALCSPNPTAHDARANALSHRQTPTGPRISVTVATPEAAGSARRASMLTDLSDDGGSAKKQKR